MELILSIQVKREIIKLLLKCIMLENALWNIITVHNIYKKAHLNLSLQQQQKNDTEI